MTRERILIVGGGIAGASLGSELATDYDVTVLEAEAGLGVHSTGRSAALFMTGYGPAPVQELTRRSEAEYERLSTLDGVPQLLTPRGGLFTAWDESSATSLRALVESQPLMTELSPEDSQRLCPALRADDLVVGGYDPNTRDIDVNALHSHYASVLRQRGGEIVLGARVVDATRHASAWTLRTEDGREWKADAVVNAAGAWGDDIARLCAGAAHGLSPRRRTMVISPTSEPVEADWPVVADIGEAWYFKPESGGVLMSPGDETEVPPGDVRPDPLDVAMVIERINEVTTLGLRSVRTSWAGLRTFAPDRAPVVGPHPDEPGLFSFVGQGGYGVQMAPALAKVGAELFRTGTFPDAALAASIAPARLPSVIDAR
jgi:D-arginine dehydrogenase